MAPSTLILNTIFIAIVKRLLVELKYQTKDNLVPNYIFYAMKNDAPQIFQRLLELCVGGHFVSR